MAEEPGLRGMDLVVSDHHAGLIRAIRQHFQGITWCQIHFVRNLLDATPKAWREELHVRVRACVDAPDPETARILLNRVLEDFEAKAPKAMIVLGRFRRYHGSAGAYGEIPKTTSDHELLGANERGDSPP